MSNIEQTNYEYRSTTSSFLNQNSIFDIPLVAPPRLELEPSGCKPDILPLNYRAILAENKGVEPFFQLSSKTALAGQRSQPISAYSPNLDNT